MASSLDLFASSLTPESLEKAKKELNEDPDTRDDAIRKLRESISNKEGEDTPQRLTISKLIRVKY